MRAVRVTCLAVAALVAAPGIADGHDRHWALPDQAKLQLAGNVGFLSPGVGWAWFDRSLEADVLFGWVPRAIGGEDIVALTGKLTWAPWRSRVADWSLRPITAALQLTYTFGDEYYLRLPDHYPHRYYTLPSALRGALAVGAGVGRAAWGLEELGMYFELVALDAMLKHWAANPRALGPTDVFSLAIGVRAAF